MNISLTADTVRRETLWAISRAKEFAIKCDRLVKVYSTGIMLYMTDEEIPQGTEKIAVCYPGGRVEIYRQGL